jgi:aquaporin Z
VATGFITALRAHWPEYLIEGWALGTFMVSAGIVATLLGAPTSPVRSEITEPFWRAAIAGLAMGATAIGLIHSPWGKRSGAHMNPAVTVTFLRLGKVKPWDALFFILAQFAGGIAGVLLVASLVGHAFTDPPVSYAATMPGARGATAAFVAEFAISAALMVVVLCVSSSPRSSRYTGLAAGCLVAVYIALESPLSGMSMNPARSFASAAPGMNWQHLWIYFVAPIVGMLSGAQIFVSLKGAQRVLCAKLLHPPNVRCIHCGHTPEIADARGAARLVRWSSNT